MRFISSHLEGVWIIEPEPHTDERGLFARTFCVHEFAEHGLQTSFVQCSTSWNAKAGTLRGLHYQLQPAAEAKLVRCTAGSLFDVAVDLRPDSKTYLQYIGVELSAGNRRAIYIPERFAHGFQTLEDNTEVFYQISEFYAPELSVGIRYDDERLAIQWPRPVSIVSSKDASMPQLDAF